MKQYLLSIYQPDGEAPPPAVLAKVMRDVNALVDETKAAGAWVFNGGLHPPSTATVVRVQRGEVLDHRRSVRRGQGAHRRLPDHQSRRSRRGARVGAQGCARDRAAGRSAAVPGRAAIEVRPIQGDASTGGDRACLPRGVRPRGGRPGPRSSATSTSPRRPSRTRSPSACERWPAAGMPPSPAGWIITTARNRAIDRLRREASRRPARAGRMAPVAIAPRARSTDEEDAVRRRSAAPDLHLLPSGARDRRAGRADAAAARRADDRRDRARVSGARADDGAAAGAREGQDPRREDSVSRAGRRRPAGPASRRARGRLSHLQRGIRGELRRPADSRRSLRGSDPARRGCSPS